jgi:type II secretory ATPase GspE/PulE/Tfp pilus assembly ATPase PilB-like protein
MSDHNTYSAEAFRSLINSGRFALPLSHCHSLEVIAALNGGLTWNALAASRQSTLVLKRQAKKLRALLAGRSHPLSLSDASDLLSSVQKVPDQGSGTLAVIPVDGPAATPVLPTGVARLLRRAMLQKQGLVLVSGPTGSGKTATIQACLEMLDKTSVNIMTVEDPIETLIPGVTQLQADNMPGSTGMTYVDSIRSMLRADPDVIMIGEMRDEQVAALTLEAAQTGHLVLSSLHADGNFPVDESLAKLGFSGVKFAAQCRILVCQRLVHKVCPKCRRAVAINSRTRAVFARGGVPLGADVSHIFRANKSGCPNCLGRGYWGFANMPEVLAVNVATAELLSKGATWGALCKAAPAEDHVSFFQSGLCLVADGLTTLDKVYEACRGR